MTFTFVMIGGAFGAACRYIIGELIMRLRSTQDFPIAMIIVNLLGSIGLAVVSYLITEAESLYLLVGTGFFGAFTTFSTFSVEAMQLWQARAYRAFATYCLVTIIGSIALFMITAEILQNVH
ncbi:CrcB protein [Alkalibacillus flavidus]|uniref:Fluoride-specific ion channel FluC n=1 Tax=Alkalibacillus flavidus TaxID=546021 RepID=A0ABV2KUE9_9BACI